MTQLNFHKNTSYKDPPPPRKQINSTLLQKAIDTYKTWNVYFQYLPKLSRYSLGIKIDNVFLEFIEVAYFSLYASKNDQQIRIEQLSLKLDSLKLLLRIAWEIKMLDSKKYSAISIPLAEIGKIIGGWKKQLIK